MTNIKDLSNEALLRQTEFCLPEEDSVYDMPTIRAEFRRRMSTDVEDDGTPGEVSQERRREIVGDTEVIRDDVHEKLQSVKRLRDRLVDIIGDTTVLATISMDDIPEALHWIKPAIHEIVFFAYDREPAPVIVDEDPIWRCPICSKKLTWQPDGSYLCECGKKWLPDRNPGGFKEVPD